MARKAIVDKNIVLKLLKEGMASRFIANRFGVSRQAIDLYRKEFIRTGILQSHANTTPPPPPPVRQADVAPVVAPGPSVSYQTFSPQIIPAAQEISLDQIIELLIKALDALKRLPELEAEAAKYRSDYENLAKQVEQLQEREKKRKEQETRWLHAQNPGILTHKDA